jgi:hypothetical protein
MKFNVNLDVKVSVWQRLDITFEAANEDAAKALIEKWNGVPEGVSIDYENTETLYDTEERLTPEDNDGQPVFEINSIEAN